MKTWLLSLVVVNIGLHIWLMIVQDVPLWGVSLLLISMVSIVFLAYKITNER